MTKKNRYYGKLALSVLLLIAIICASIKPVSQDLSSIVPSSQIALQGQNKDSTNEVQSPIKPTDSIRENTQTSNEQEKDPLKDEQDYNENESEQQSEQQPPKPPTGELPSSATAADENSTVIDDASIIEVVAKADEKQQYFTTNLRDGMTVTEEIYRVTISQLTDLVVEEMHIQLNDDTLSDFKGQLQFKEGKNHVVITMYYTQQNGEQLAVKQSYRINLNTKDIVIQTTVTEEKVTEAIYRFTASASKAGRNVPLTVKVNEEEVTAKAGYSYAVTLQPGQNIFVFTATDGTEKINKTYKVHYDQAKAKISFKTDLVDQKVGNAMFSFTAQALYGEELIDLTVSFNEKVLKESENYKVELQNGTNIIELQTKYEDERLTKRYKILYVDPNVVVEEEKDELAPTIKTDLVTGSHVKGLIKTINVWPTTADGKRIRGKNVSVKVNGVGTPFVWDDAEKTSYKLSFKDGKNNVEIRVWDDDGRVTKETFTVTAENLENKVIGQATISVEGSVVGIPYFIAPTKVDIHQGEKGSFIVDQLLRKNGFKYDHTGTLQNNFYLSTIKKQNMLANLKIPDDLWLLVEESSTRANRDEYDPHSLGEFDFANGAGWMYSINGDYPNYGLSNAYFLDGDVVRIRFTLHYGKDIAGFTGLGGGSGGDWGKEW